MNRKLLIVMILTAAFAAEGCRRGGGEKKPPVSVLKETDFLYTRKTDVIGAGLAPIPKAAPGANFTPEQLKGLQEAEARNKKAKQDADNKKRRDDTAAMGSFLLNYRRSNPITTYAHDDLKKALRRQNLHDRYEELEKKEIDVVYLADSYNPKHILCYHKTAETDEDVVSKKTIQVGHPAIFAADGAPGFIKTEDLPRLIKEQELQVCWYYYVQLRAPKFYRVGAEFDEFKAAMKRQDPFWLPPAPPASPPPFFLAKLQQRKPDLLRNPPDPRNFDRFKKYLNENAPPNLLGLIEKNTLSVSLKTDLNVATEPIACFVATEPNDKNGAERGHMGINAASQIGLYDRELMKKWIAQNKN